MTRSPDSLSPPNSGQPEPEKRDDKALTCWQEDEANLRAAAEVYCPPARPDKEGNNRNGFVAVVGLTVWNVVQIRAVAVEQSVITGLKRKFGPLNPWLLELSNLCERNSSSHPFAPMKSIDRGRNL